MSQPWRFTLYWTAAVENTEEAEILYGSVEDWVEHAGGHVEGGSMGRMKDEDVVEESPLAIDLASNTGRSRDE